MMERMIPRGPDAAGASRAGWPWATAVMKIIDLSERPQQPMVDAELGLAIAFNGCSTYNYLELRRQLQQAGYWFFSSGDTEVILKAWHAWGPTRSSGSTACSPSPLHLYVTAVG